MRRPVDLTSTLFNAAVGYIGDFLVQQLAYRNIETLCFPPLPFTLMMMVSDDPTVFFQDLGLERVEQALEFPDFSVAPFEDAESERREVVVQHGMCRADPEDGLAGLLIMKYGAEFRWNYDKAWRAALLFHHPLFDEDEDS